VTEHPRFNAVEGHPGKLIDLSEWRLNQQPDEHSDEDWDGDREPFGPTADHRNGACAAEPLGCVGSLEVSWHPPHVRHQQATVRCVKDPA
jgi:hypothetical protein